MMKCWSVMTRSVGGGSWCSQDKRLAARIGAGRTTVEDETGTENSFVKFCSALTFGGVTTNSPCARVFVQQLPLTWLPLTGASGFDCRWLSEQQLRSPCGSDEGSWAWQQMFPVEAAAQQEPPQQQPVPEEQRPRQNRLWLPFGQTQSK